MQSFLPVFKIIEIILIISSVVFFTIMQYQNIYQGEKMNKSAFLNSPAYTFLFRMTVEVFAGCYVAWPQVLCDSVCLWQC